jgi:alanine dehydrogenase
MTELVVLSEDDVRSVLDLEELAEALASALIALSEGTVSVPARMAARGPSGLLGTMPGYVPGLGLAAKVVSVYPENPRSGRPAHHALIAVFDEVSGAPCALMGATYITAIRTALTAALVARALARPQSTSLAIIGAGVQADAHLSAFSHLMELDDTRIASRHVSKAAELAERHAGAVVAATVEEALDGADVICCCTDAQDSVLADAWLGPGTHVSSVGSGPELPPPCWAEPSSSSKAVPRPRRRPRERLSCKDSTQDHSQRWVTYWRDEAADGQLLTA